MTIISNLFLICPICSDTNNKNKIEKKEKINDRDSNGVNEENKKISKSFNFEMKKKYEFD